MIPKEPGYYWIDNDFISSAPKIVKVFTRPGHNYLCISAPHVCSHTKSDFLAIKKLGGEWSPRIPEYF